MGLLLHDDSHCAHGPCATKARNGSGSAGDSGCGCLRGWVPLRLLDANNVVIEPCCDHCARRPKLWPTDCGPLRRSFAHSRRPRRCAALPLHDVVRVRGPRTPRSGSYTRKILGSYGAPAGLRERQPDCGRMAGELGDTQETRRHLQGLTAPWTRERRASRLDVHPWRRRVRLLGLVEDSSKARSDFVRSAACRKSG